MPTACSVRWIILRERRRPSIPRALVQGSVAVTEAERPGVLFGAEKKAHGAGAHGRATVGLSARDPAPGFEDRTSAHTPAGGPQTGVVDDSGVPPSSAPSAGEHDPSAG